MNPSLRGNLEIQVVSGMYRADNAVHETLLGNEKAPQDFVWWE